MLQTYLWIACFCSLHIFEVIGSNIKTPKEGAIFRAIQDGDVSRLESWFHSGVLKVDDSILDGGEKGLHVAANFSMVDVIQFYHDKGASMDCHNNEDYTPLAYAVTFGSLEAVQVLISLNADVNHQCGIGTYAEDPYIEESIWNQKFNKGETALFIALSSSVNEKSAIAIIETLLENSANPTICDTQSRMTPLHVAATRGYQNAAKLLLSKISRNVQENLLKSLDIHDNTPQDTAKIARHIQLHYFLKNYLDGGEFAQEDFSYIEENVEKVSESATKIQIYVNSLATMSIDDFQHNEAKEMIQNSGEQNLTESFETLNEHLTIAKRNGEHWNQKLLPDIKTVYLQLRNFGKVFVESFDSVMHVSKPDNIEELLRIEKKEYQDMGIFSQMQIQKLIEKKRLSVTFQKKVNKHDFSKGLKEIEYLLDHILTHAKSNKEAAKKLADSLSEFRNNLENDYVNFEEDLDFLKFTAKAMSLESLKETVERRITLSNDLGMKRDVELEQLLTKIDEEIKTIRTIMQGRLIVAGVSTSLQLGQGITWIGKHLTQQRAKKMVRAESTSRFKKYARKITDKLNPMKFKSVTGCNKAMQTFKNMGRGLAGLTFSVGIADMVQTSLTLSTLVKSKEEFQKNVNQVFETLEEIVRLEGELLTVNRTIRAFEITTQSREKATGKLEKLTDTVNEAQKEVTILHNAWSEITINLGLLLKDAKEIGSLTAEKKFLLVEAELNVLREQWSSISDEAFIIRSYIPNIYETSDGKRVSKRSVKIQPRISYDSSSGRKAMKNVDSGMNEAIKLVYLWQDRTHIETAKAARKLGRFILELGGNINQAQRMIRIFDDKTNVSERKIKAIDSVNSEYDGLNEFRDREVKKHSRLGKRRQLLFQRVFKEDIQNDIDEALQVATNTTYDLGHFQIVCINTVAKLDENKEFLHSLKRVSQTKINNQYLRMIREKDKLDKAFASITYKTDTQIALQASMIAMAAASMATAAIPVVGWAISLSITAASIALQAGINDLTDEIAQLSEDFIEMNRAMVQMRVDLGRIDLDLETATALTNEITAMTQILNGQNEMTQDKDDWENILATLRSMLSHVHILIKEVEQEDFAFAQVDVKILSEEKANIFGYLKDMKLVF